MARRIAIVAGMVAGLVTTGCASAPADGEAEIPTTPIPSAGLAGQTVAVYPFTMLLPETSLEWDSVLPPREEALAHADSILYAMLEERVPEITWAGPEALRRAAERAPGMVPDPDQMGNAVLRNFGISTVPDPLRSQLRLLTGMVADRFAFIPASLLFYAEDETPDPGDARAELTVALVDVRTGAVGWRTVARGVSDDPWRGLRLAIEELSPFAR